MKKYQGHITVKDKEKENVIYLKFTDDDMMTAMEMIEGILRFTDGETCVFIRRDED